MASRTVENYLKQIYVEQQKAKGGLVPTGRLASALEVTPGSVTAMIKVLADSGLAEYERRSGTQLTDRGRLLALHVLRRHRLVEQFLVSVLKLDWSEVHEEAEELEHAISDKVLEKIDRFLGYPAVDPHGDPIPSAKGQFSANPSLESLTSCELSRPLRLVRVLDQDARFLQFAHQQGLLPGICVVVEHRDPVADAVTVVLPNKSTMTLGTAAAAKILVEPGPAEG